MAYLSRSFVVKISVMAVVVYLTAQTASGIMCYQCNSARDPGCADINGNSTDSSYYKPCEPVRGQNKQLFCRTVTQTIKDRDNMVRVVRSCGWERHPRRNCYEYEDKDHQERVCQCFEDGCNSKAPHVLKPSVIAPLICSLPLVLLYGR